ncbi:MAG: mannose-6-phosphate isomerase [Conexibacter sp.]|nr:mannose-6-phosphate isomerase [Conexibacter sp.]
MSTAAKPTLVEKPWGHELILERNDQFVVKRIFISAGSRSSLQSHEHKREWVRVEEGTVEVTAGPDVHNLEVRTYGAGTAYRVAPTVIHRVLAVEDAYVLEVASPPSDEDIMRYDDDYGRGR